MTDLLSQMHTGIWPRASFFTLSDGRYQVVEVGGKVQDFTDRAQAMREVERLQLGTRKDSPHV